MEVSTLLGSLCHVYPMTDIEQKTGKDSGESLDISVGMLLVMNPSMLSCKLDSEENIHVNTIMKCLSV